MEQKYLSINKMINRLFNQNSYLKSAIFAVVIVSIVLVLSISQLIFGYQSASKSGKIVKTSASTGNKPDTRQNQDEKDLRKEMQWMENQLAISVADSMNLGINLNDSVIQLNFKGLSLISSDIYGIYPKNFLKNISGNEYAYFFGKPLNVEKSWSNVKKRKFRKIKVNSTGDHQVLDTDELKPDLFVWEFSLDNNLNFVFFWNTI